MLDFGGLDARPLSLEGQGTSGTRTGKHSLVGAFMSIPSPRNFSMARDSKGREQENSRVWERKDTGDKS